MGRRARWGLLTAALLLGASASARADDDRANREAEARFKEGLARVKSKDYEAARLSFEQAYAVLHRPLILWNLALAEEKTAHPLDALAHFRQVAREAAGDADRAGAQKHVDALLGQLGHIDVQAPPGTGVTLDGGDVVGTAPLDPLDVMPGHHVVAAKMAAGSTRTSEVDAVAGQVAHVAFAADPPPAIVAVDAVSLRGRSGHAGHARGAGHAARAASLGGRRVAEAVLDGAYRDRHGARGRGRGRRGLRGRASGLPRRTTRAPSSGYQNEHPSTIVLLGHAGAGRLRAVEQRPQRAEPRRRPLERPLLHRGGVRRGRDRELVLLAQGGTREDHLGAARCGAGEGRGRGRRAVLKDGRAGRSSLMRSWMLWVGLVGALLLVAFAYGCGETSFGTCADNATCPSDGGAPDGTGADVSIDVAPHPDGGTCGDDGSVPQADAQGGGDGAPACVLGKEPKDEPCLVDSTYGVFVSPTGSASGTGTKTSPLNSIDAGITLAVTQGGATPKNVYVCAGTYDETIAIGPSRDKVQVFGGFSCADFSYTGAARDARAVGPGDSPDADGSDERAVRGSGDRRAERAANCPRHGVRSGRVEHRGPRERRDGCRVPKDEDRRGQWPAGSGWGAHGVYVPVAGASWQ